MRNYRPKKTIQLSEPAILATLPFAGSLIALIFESGYLAFFEVPATFAQIDFIRIATATFALGIFAGILAALFLAAALIAQHPHPVRRALTLPLATGILVTPIVFFVPEAAKSWWVFILIIAFISLLYLLPPALFRRNEGSYLQRLERDLNKEEEAARTAKAKQSALQAQIDRIMTPVSALIFLSIFTAALGHFCAESRTVHYVLKDAPDWVLVTTYNDTIILKKFDPTTRQLGQETRIQKPSDSTATTLIRTPLGRLLPPKSQRIK